jgi:hypothetical protein
MKSPQQPLRVISGFALRFAEGDVNPAGQTGQQKGTLDLRTGDRHLVMQRAEIPAGDGERQTVAMLLDKSRSHGRQWHGNPPHGAAPE